VNVDPPDDQEVLNVEDWAEIRRLHRAEQMPIRAICRQLGVGRNTVRRALSAQSAPRYQRALKGSIVDEVEPRIRELLRQWPSMPATVIAERIGWTRSITVLKDRVRVLRPLYLPPDPAQRTDYLQGEVAQCDLWFPPVQIPLGYGQTGSPPVLVMVTGYARWLSAVMIPSRQTPDLLCGQWTLIRQLGATPKTLVWDNESGIGQWRGGRPQLTTAMNAFRGTLGIRVVQCRPADPESKGLVERANGYLETSFLPGRKFSSPADFNTQLQAWLNLANNRQHRGLGCRPADRIDADRAAMVTLPPVAPVVGWRLSTRLPRDHYVRLDANDYSVHPGAVGRRVEVAADATQIRVTCDGKPVAQHHRCWARHQSITDPAHRAAADQLRIAHRQAQRTPIATLVQARNLSDYDRTFGLAEEVA
jgi:transposase